MLEALAGLNDQPGQVDAVRERELPPAAAMSSDALQMCSAAALTATSPMPMVLAQPAPSPEGKMAPRHDSGALA